MCELRANTQLRVSPWYHPNRKPEPAGHGTSNLEGDSDVPERIPIDSPPMPPSTIGPYQIERELGRGGMGEVYLARDTRLDREVAIKALPAHLAQDADRLARFQREAKVLASLNHPGIGAIYGLEEVNGFQYLILEFVKGETLADRLVKGPVPVDEALPLPSRSPRPSSPRTSAWRGPRMAPRLQPTPARSQTHRRCSRRSSTHPRSPA
jgi:serine/threonine protein kinase